MIVAEVNAQKVVAERTALNQHRKSTDQEVLALIESSPENTIPV